MSSYGAVFHNQHQIVYIQAIEKSEIYTCSRLELLSLWKANDAWKLLVQKITEMDCLSIKQEHIASYLGISPETLSCIKIK